MADFHMPKGYELFISSTSLISILVAGALTGAILIYLGQKRGHQQK